MRGFPSDTYSNVTVSGDCFVPGGAVINVTGNVYVAPGAVINSELAPSTITGGRNVTGTNTGSFLLNGATVKGNVTFTGGGSDMIP